MIDMSDKQVLENFKQAFPPKIEAQLLEIDDIDEAIGETRFPIYIGINLFIHNI